MQPKRPESKPTTANRIASEVRWMQTATCPACGHHVAVPFFDGGELPLTTLAWPEDEQAAESLPRLPHSFVRCVDCGHVYNRDFDYADVPYSDKPNLMFNDGAIWSEHIENVCRILLERLPANPTVVEIGCGNGQLLRSLAKQRPGGTYIGFDPNADIDSKDGLIEGRIELFVPDRHIAECQADVIISRHVLEHLMNPLGFLQALAFAASWESVDTCLFLEVPCIDQVLRRGRTVDFFYEHNSHFTTDSFTRMLQRCAAEVQLVQTAYNDEVVFGLARLCQRDDQLKLANDALRFRRSSALAASEIRSQLDSLARAGRRMAIWGGTGKAAAFINQHGLDRERFPLVVDSDPNKVGTFVPGTGQLIRAQKTLLAEPVDSVLIATQWRAADIVWEMQQLGIECQQVLIEHRGAICDYFRDQHPYQATPTRARIDAPERGIRAHLSSDAAVEFGDSIADAPSDYS